MKVFVALTVSIVIVSSAVGQTAASAKPNVLIILADDMGWGDPHCYQAESKVPTPNIDRLAAAGVRFTDAHTPSAVCTPTRYGLLTGRYCWRTSLKSGVLDGVDPPLIDPDRPTIATFLKKQGYTTACIGKWHLGMTWVRKDGTPMNDRVSEGATVHRGGSEIDYSRDTTGGPIDHGFDTYFGISASLDMSPYAFIEGRHVTELPTVEQPDIRETALSTSAGVRAASFTLEGVLPELTRHAVKFVEERKGQANPFFLYLPLTSPHLPVVPSAEWKDRTGAGIYADFAAQTDDTVGQVLAALEKSGQADNTIVLFTSDNGGLWHQWEPKEADDLAGYKPTPRGNYNLQHGHRSNATLRGTKADIWEGGHRVPFIVRWPARIAVDASKPLVSDRYVELNDVFATIADATGTALPDDGADDSFSFLTVLTHQQATGPERTFGVNHSMQGVFGLREGLWKYVPSRGSGGFSAPKTVKPKPGEPEGQLYNLDTDLAETRNLAGVEKERVGQMAKKLAEIQAADRTRPR